MYGCGITAGRCNSSVTKDHSITRVLQNISAENSDGNIMPKMKPEKNSITGQE
jgi:hypothetical protein